MKRLIAFTLIALMVLMVGCARTKQARTAKQTGFLGDYSKLQKERQEKKSSTIKTRRPTGQGTIKYCWIQLRFGVGRNQKMKEFRKKTFRA